MEVAGEGPATPGLGPLTSTPNTAAPPPPPGLPERVVSSSSLSSESSEEDWLIKICCPGARHRYCKNVRFIKPARTEYQQNLDEDELAERTPNTSHQSYPGKLRKESSDLEWLIKLHCPRAQMEQWVSDPKQSLPEVSSLSKAGRSCQSVRAKPSGNWLTQKHLSAMQASCAPGSPVSVCVQLPPFLPLSESSSYPSEHSYFPSFLPPFPFSLLSISPSTSPPVIILPSILLPPSVPPHFFHFLPPLPPYLHSPSLFLPSPFFQLSPSVDTNSSTILPVFPPAPLPSPSLPASQPSVALNSEQPSQEPPAPQKSASRDFSAYHSHNPFFLPVPPPVQTHRGYQARQKNSDSAKYP